MVALPSRLWLATAPTRRTALISEFQDGHGRLSGFSASSLGRDRERGLIYLVAACERCSNQ